MLKTNYATHTQPSNETRQSCNHFGSLCWWSPTSCSLITACSLHFTEHQFLVPGLCCAQLPMLKMTLVLTLRQTGSGLLKPSWLLLPGVQLSWSARCALCTATLHSASRTFTTQLCSVDCTQLYTTVQDRVCCLNKTTAQYTQRHHFIESFRHNDILL